MLVLYMTLDNKIVKSTYSPLAILSLILVGITASRVWLRLAGGGITIMAGIEMRNDCLVRTD